MSTETQAPDPAPRPFTAVKAFADSVLAMLDERIKMADQGTHPYNDYFGDKPEAIVTAKAQASELREVRTQVRMLGDRALVDLMKLKPAIPAPEGGPALSNEQIDAAVKAWFVVTTDNERDYRARMRAAIAALAALAAPAPQAAPVALTDEQIVHIYERPELAGTRHESGTAKAIAIARAIERAHGIPAPQTKEPR